MAEQQPPDLMEAMERPPMVGAWWLVWRDSEQTQAFLAMLRASVKGEQDGWLGGHYLSTDKHASDVENSLHLGSARALNRLIEMIEGIKIEAEQPKKDAEDEE